MKNAAFVFAVILFSSCVLDMGELDSSNYWKSSDPFQLGAYAKFTKKSGIDFKIMTLTDTHIGWWKNDSPGAVEKTFAMIRKAVNEHHPDLLVLTGDNSVGTGLANMNWGWGLIAFLDSLNTPYALVMGNHDGSVLGDVYNYNRQEAIARLFESGEHSLFTCGPRGVHGMGNYGINIFDGNGDLFYSLVLLDSSQDYLRENQVEWYRWYINGIKGAAGTTIKSLVFFHIPLPEMLAAKTALEATDPEAAADMFKGGICEQTRNTGMFAAAQALGSTTHFFFGHDHPNMGIAPYNGINLVYCLKTGYCEPDGDRVGVTLITINEAKNVGVVFKRY